MKKITSRLLGGTCLAAAALSAGTSAFAADDAGQNAEIVVTAQKRAEKISDVAVSMTAFSEVKMRDIRLENSNDVAAGVPNVKIAPFFGNQFASTFIRGSGKVDFNANAKTTVGVYLDEVYLPNVFSHTMPLYDMERVEILRGPQGTLYGRNATAGAVNYITNKPTKEFEAYATAGIGNYNAWNLEGAVSGPIAENLQGRIAATIKQDDGWMEGRNTYPGSVSGDLNDTKVFAGRGSLQWEPTDKLKVLVSGHYGLDRSQGFFYQHKGTVDPVTFLPTCNSSERPDCIDYFGYADNDGDMTKGDFNFGGRARLETGGGFVRVEYDLGDMLLTGITGVENVDRYIPNDDDASPNTIVHDIYTHSSLGYSTEWRLTSTNESKLDWIVGVYAGVEDIDSYNEYLFFSTLTTQTFSEKSESYAAFVNAGYKITDKLKLVAGLRQTQDKIRTDHSSVYEDAVFGIPPGTPFDPGQTAKRTYDDTSWKIGLDYKPADDVLIYGLIAKGYKSGGVNTGFGDPAEFNAYKPEELISYEVGAKATWLDGRLTTSAALFHYDYSDLQVFDTFAGAFGTLFVIDNAEEATYDGVELEIGVEPIDNLVLNFSGSWLDATFDKFTRNATGEDLSGNKNVYAPEYQFDASVSYSFPTAIGDVRLASDLSYTDELYHTVTNESDLAGDSYVLVGGRAGVTLKNGVEVSLWGRNLTDEDYRVASFDFRSSGFIIHVPNRPRTFGVEITKRW